MRADTGKGRCHETRGRPVGRTRPRCSGIGRGTPGKTGTMGPAGPKGIWGRPAHRGPWSSEPRPAWKLLDGRWAYVVSARNAGSDGDLRIEAYVNCMDERVEARPPAARGGFHGSSARAWSGRPHHPGVSHSVLGGCRPECRRCCVRRRTPTGSTTNLPVRVRATFAARKGEKVRDLQRITGGLPNDIIAKAVNADKIDGLDSTAFLPASGQAADAAQLEGRPLDRIRTFKSPPSSSTTPQALDEAPSSKASVPITTPVAGSVQVDGMVSIHAIERSPNSRALGQSPRRAGAGRSFVHPLSSGCRASPVYGRRASPGVRQKVPLATSLEECWIFHKDLATW